MDDSSRDLATIARIVEATVGDSTVGDMLSRICREVAEGCGFDRVAISRLADGDGRSTPQLASFGLPDVPLEGTLLPEDVPGLARAGRSRDVLHVRDARSQPSLPDRMIEDLGVTSLYVVPVISRDRCIAYLFADRGGTAFGPDAKEKDLLKTIGAVVGALLQNELAQSELRRLDEVKRRFIALASHELRTPIQAVYGVLSTLHRRGGQLREEQRVELRAMAYKQADRLRCLADQLLDLSRLDSEAIAIEPQLLPIRRKVEDIVLLVAEQRAIGVTVDIPPDLEAAVDEHAIDRIVSNLLSNALRYGETPIRISAEQRDTHFRLALEDSGAGVTPEFVPVMFERFRRSEESVEGAGLGLSIAQSYARAHGGEIMYRAVEPQGACFDLVIPTPHPA